MQELTRYQRRNLRRLPVRSRTIAARSITKSELRVGRALYGDGDHWRPQTRGDCDQVPRPCPYVGCRYNLFIDATESGGVKLNFPEREPGDLSESCALDVAENDGESPENVAELMNITRERVRQIEVVALEKVRDARRLESFVDGDRRRPCRSFQDETWTGETE